jgi:putative tryptophan/tyrosine transport system substrate-binding protein
MLPAARRFAVLSDTTARRPGELQAMHEAARALGVALQSVGVRSPSDFAAAFDAMRASGAEGVDIVGSSMLFNFRNELGALALAHKLPAICEWPEMAVAGCLASYGTSLRELYGNLAELTADILNGASPADTPVRQPTRFELVINGNTAKTLGVTIPERILGQADEVIE